MIYKVHNNTDIVLSFTVKGVDLTTLNNLAIRLFNPVKDIVKKSAANTLSGYDDDLTITSATTFTLVIDRDENIDWMLGKYTVQLIAIYDETGFEDDLRIESDANTPFQIVDDTVPTDKCDVIKVCLTPIVGDNGAKTFIELTDTPNDYTNYEGFSVHVNEDGTGLEFVEDVEVGSVIVSYRFDTDTNPTEPNSGRLKLNDSDYTLVDEIYVSETTRTGDTNTGMLLALNAHDVIVIQDNNTDKFISFNVVGKGIDNGDWWTIPVAYRNESGGVFHQGERFKLGAIFVGAKNFTGLNDTPNNYNAAAGKAVVVKDDESGLEFKDVVKPNVNGSTSVANNIWVGSQAEYDALGSYDDETLYFIKL